jgi:hypothetical protein
MAPSGACRAAVGEILKIRLIRAKDAAPVGSVLYESAARYREPGTGYPVVRTMSRYACHVAWPKRGAVISSPPRSGA